MPAPTVRIRMYKQGLGDCFLLTFTRRKATPYYILIDCGAVTGSDPKDVIAAAQDIFNVTNGRLDLVVGTHEHWDHLSGFSQARSIFDQFKIGNVWLSWTEDPTNPIAQSLIKNRAAKVSALRSAMTQMSAADNQLKESIQQVLCFFGEEDGASQGLSAAGTNTTADCMQYLRNRRDARVHYCNPAQDAPHALEGVDGVRVYVFGPPTDLKLLKQDLPTVSGHETYGITSKPAEDSFLAAVMADGGADGKNGIEMQVQAYPFDKFYRISLAEAQDPQGDDFFRQNYGFSKDDPDAWRRIDQDWLNLTSELALNLDSDTNNTSLVLAFELGEPGKGKVLLFAADAQVGNWLSWGNLSWSLSASGRPDQKITALDLLKRTIFYKVGHHGSHNATLSTQGLELMTSDTLVAMLPVVQSMAAKKGWKAMPYDVLLDNLKKKTKGRIVRIDTGVPQRPDAADLTDAEWRTFKSHVQETPLYIEYKLPME